MNNSIKSLKFIYYLAKFNQDHHPQVKINNETYRGLNNEKIPLKILSRIGKHDDYTVIIFPGASHEGEEHKGMLFLGSIICKLGYNVLIPRIPPLKELKINVDCFDWFAHAYSQIILRKNIIKSKIITIGMSFGGALLLKASFDPRISNNPPKSVMTFGTYCDIQSTLKFLCNGKIELDDFDRKSTQ